MIALQCMDIRNHYIDKSKLSLEENLSVSNEVTTIVSKLPTPNELRNRMQAGGIHPEDNLASCGIIAAREE